jgi:hypothetical protein
MDQSFLSNEVLYVQSHHRATVGASDESFIERRKQTADVARCGFGHSCILLRGAAGVVVFQPSGLWSTLLSLKTLDRYWRTSNSYSLAVGFK